MIEFLAQMPTGEKIFLAMAVVVSRIFRTFGWLSGARPWLTR